MTPSCAYSPVANIINRWLNTRDVISWGLAMSMEIHVLSNKRLASIAEWQQAIDFEGFKLKLDPTVPLDAARGFLPALLHGKQSGFECYHDDIRDLMETYGHVPYFKSGPAWKHVLSFRWGSLLHEGVSVFMAGTAYARATGGVIYEPEEGRALTLDEARETACQWEKEEFSKQ